MKILITGADRGLGFGIVKILLERGETVYAGSFIDEWNELEELLKKFPNSLTIIPIDVSSDSSVETAAKILSGLTKELDVIINNAGINGVTDDYKSEFTDTDMMLSVYNVNAVGSVRVVERFLPFLENGTEKKLCFVSSEAGSITQSNRDSFFWYCMTKSALNMYVKILFNKLRPQKYNFRLYHPGWIKSYMSGKLSAQGILTIDKAAEYAVDYFVDQTIDEDIFVMKGYDGEIFEF